jgi:hypothetical protein
VARKVQMLEASMIRNQSFMTDSIATLIGNLHHPIGQPRQQLAILPPPTPATPTSNNNKNNKNNSNNNNTEDEKKKKGKGGKDPEKEEYKMSKKNFIPGISNKLNSFIEQRKKLWFWGGGVFTLPLSCRKKLQQQVDGKTEVYYAIKRAVCHNF